MSDQLRSQAIGEDHPIPRIKLVPGSDSTSLAPDAVRMSQQSAEVDNG